MERNHFYGSSQIIAGFLHIRGFIEINGSAAGETSGAPLSLLIPDGRLLLFLFPAGEHGQPGLSSLSRILSLDCDPPCVVCDDGHIMLEVLPDQMIFARIDPPYIAKSQEMLPHILCSLSIPAGNKELRGIIYFDRTFNFSFWKIHRAKYYLPMPSPSLSRPPASYSPHFRRHLSICRRTNRAGKGRYSACA